jgi:hypothetical protein
VTTNNTDPRRPPQKTALQKPKIGMWGTDVDFSSLSALVSIVSPLNFSIARGGITLLEECPRLSTNGKSLRPSKSM